MPELHILPIPEEAAQAAAGFVADLAEECVSRRGRFTIALSGGSTPHKLYRVLATPPHAKQMTWDRWHVFWGDERRKVRKSPSDIPPILRNVADLWRSVCAESLTP